MSNGTVASAALGIVVNDIDLEEGDGGEIWEGSQPKERTKQSCRRPVFSRRTVDSSSSSIDADCAAEVELLDLLGKALIHVGVTNDDGQSKKVDAIMSTLAKLYIRTPDQLNDALEEPEVIQQVAGCITGMLLPAVRAQLEYRARARSKWPEMIDSADHCKLNKPLCRKLEVARVDVTHLAEIDQISQTFFARLLVVLRIRGGANDPDLTSGSEDFPFDKHGRPTFRPSALWYLGQIDFPNGKDLRVLESKVTKDGNDLKLVKRVEGTFFERFELSDFPFDQQDLTVTISANCACEGPVPLEFRHADDAQLGVDMINFPHGDIWDLSPSPSASLATVGASSARRFPAVHLRVRVRRHCGFVLVNAAMPMSIISLLSLTTFFVQPEDTADRLELSITILLTAVAFKYTTSSYLPQISYMTAVDRFTLFGTLIIVVVCLSHTVLGYLSRWVEVSDGVLDWLNKAFFLVILMSWSAVQLWFVYRAMRVSNSRLLRRELLKKQSGTRRISHFQLPV